MKLDITYDDKFIYIPQLNAKFPINPKEYELQNSSNKYAKIKRLNEQFKRDLFSSSDKKIRHKDVKQESDIINTLISLEPELTAKGISLFVAVRALCALYNYGYKETAPFRCPDRYLYHRTKMGKDTISYFLYLLAKKHLINIIYQNGERYMTINTTEFIDDVYFDIKCDELRKKDMEILRKCRNYGNIYIDPFSRRTQLKRRRYILLGCMWVFNKDLGKYWTTEEREILLTDPLTGDRIERSDILYTECLFDVIAEVTGYSVADLKYHIGKIARCSKYLSKHRKVYIDKVKISVNGEEYRESHMDKDYKKNYDCSLSYTAEYESGRPPVTSSSYIIFTDEFLNTKTGKYIREHEEDFRQILACGLMQLVNEKESNKKTAEECNIQDDDKIKPYIDLKYQLGVIDGDRYHLFEMAKLSNEVIKNEYRDKYNYKYNHGVPVGFSMVKSDYDKGKKIGKFLGRLRNPKDWKSKLGIQNICERIDKILKILSKEETIDNIYDFKYYINMMNEYTDHLKYLYYEAKEEWPSNEIALRVFNSVMS